MHDFFVDKMKHVSKFLVWICITASFAVGHHEQVAELLRSLDHEQNTFLYRLKLRIAAISRHGIMFDIKSDSKLMCQIVTFVFTDLPMEKIGGLAAEESRKLNSIYTEWNTIWLSVHQHVSRVSAHFNNLLDLQERTSRTNDKLMQRVAELSSIVREQENVIHYLDEENGRLTANNFCLFRTTE